MRDRGVPADRPAPLHAADAHSRAILTLHFEAPVHNAGIESRPVFSVVSAILRPSPSRARRLAAGTRTLSNLVRPFSMPFRPMNALRRSTVIPASPTRRRRR